MSPDPRRPAWLSAWLLPVTLGLAHGVSDGAAGFLLGRLAATGTPLAEVAVLVLIYNVLAFGLQPVAGLLVDESRRPRAAAIAGLVLVLVGLMLSTWPLAAVVLTGVGSAFFHVGGGALVLVRGAAVSGTFSSASRPGLFAAPGVLGLAVGGALAAGGYAAAWAIALLLAAHLAALLAQPAPRLAAALRPHEPILERHDAIMVALLTAIALRSAVWATLQYALEGNLAALLLVAVAAAAGKVAGGFLADRFGWRRWAVFALLAATPVLLLGGQRLVWLLPGIALVQSATPAAIVAAARLLPGRPATATGLVLGLAVAVGGLPLILGMAPQLAMPAVAAAAVGAAAGLFWVATRPLAHRRPAGRVTPSP